jgi:hypothetical protein
MTTQAAATPYAPAAATDDSRQQRLLALSGVAFVPLFLVGWFASAGVTPHYTASDQDWTDWAHDSKWNGRISAFAMLLAAFVFLYFMSVIRGCSGVRSLGLGVLHNSAASRPPVPSPAPWEWPWPSSRWPPRVPRAPTQTPW